MPLGMVLQLDFPQGTGLSDRPQSFSPPYPESPPTCLKGPPTTPKLGLDLHMPCYYSPRGSQAASRGLPPSFSILSSYGLKVLPSNPPA